MFGTGTSPMRGAIRRLTGVMSIGAALLLLLTGIAVLGSASVAGASAKTTVSSFAAKPTSLTYAGGSVTLSAKVANAKTCTFSVTPTIKGLPATKSCTSSTVTEKVTVPKNTKTTAITYTFGLSVKGTTTVKATAVKLTVGTEPPPTVSNFKATPSSLSWAGGTVTLSATVTNATTCTFSVTPTIKGLPATKSCTNGTVDETVTVPKNTGTKPINYTFALSVTGATATGTTTVEAKPLGLSIGGVLPSAPTGVSASPGNASATVSFKPPSSSGSSAISRYTVTATDTTTSANGGQRQSGTSSPITVSGLTNGDSYTFTVSATNGSGTGPASAKSNSVIPDPLLANVVSTASDGDGYCAVLSTGGVDCWGDNTDGELGNGTTGGPDGAGYDTPQSVTDIANAVSVTSDYSGYCAMLSTGGVDCWGDNTDGELGNGTIGGPDGEGGYDTPQSVSGITNAVSVTSGFGPLDGESYCAVLSTGGLDCWGGNEEGELGNGTIGGPDACGDGDSCYDTPQAVSGITNAVSVTSSVESYCAVLSTGGLDCWGLNGGQLGNGTIGGPDACYEGGDSCYDTPQPVSGITEAVSVTGGYFGYCAVLSTGGVDCWGDNEAGELGNGTTEGPDGADYDTPQAVSGITDAVSVTSGSSGDGFGYCAVLSTGGADCWGYNGFGELGNGTTGGPDCGNGTCYDTPQSVVGITNAVSVSSDGDGYCAVLSTGGVDCWGYNYYGELGNGTVDGPDGEGGYDTPQVVTGITDAVSVSNDGYDLGSYCAVLSTGGVDCWGWNGVGQLGNGIIGGPDGPDGGEGYDTPQEVITP